MKKYIHFIIDLVIIAALVAVDRFTKNVVVANIKGKDPVQIIGDFFTFQYLENTGAAFSILRDQREFFLVISLVFSVIILGLLLYIPVKKKYYPLRIILVFLCAGAIGNMIDRFLLHYVVDFISVGTFPIFNVADIYVTVSTTLLVIFVLFIYKDEDLNFKEANKQKIHSSMLASPAKENEKEKDGENEKAISTVKSSTDTLSPVAVSSSTEAPSVIEVDTSVDSPSVIEVDTSVEAPSVSEADTSVDPPSVMEVDTSVEAPSVTEVNTSVGSPSVIEVDTGVEAPSVTEVNTSVGSPSVIEVDTSADSPSVIELKTSVESPSVIDAKTGGEKPASDKKKKETGKEKPKKKKETGKEKPASDKKKKENGKGRSKKKKKETDKNKPEETKEDNLKKKEDKTENGKDKLTPYEGIDNPDFLAFLESEKAIEKPSSGLSSTSDDIFFLLGATSLEKPGPELNLIMDEIEKEIKKD